MTVVERLDALLAEGPRGGQTDRQWMASALAAVARDLMPAGPAEEVGGVIVPGGAVTAALDAYAAGQDGAGVAAAAGPLVAARNRVGV